MTIDELLAEIEAAHKGAEGQTTEEWAETMGCSLAKARIVLKRLLKERRMERGQVRRRSDLDNKLYNYTVYRIL